MNLRRFVVGLALGLILSAHAELKLNGMFTDNMVLQRSQQVPVWGTADPGAEVTVEFAGQKETTEAKPDGSWTVNLKSMRASSRPRVSSLTENAMGSPTQ